MAHTESRCPPLWLGLTLALACDPPADATSPTASEAPEAAASAAIEATAPTEPAPSELDENFPLHGLVTGLQLKVRLKPDPEALVTGWLRMGSRVRLADGPVKTKTCSSGWYPIHPRGHVCVGEGVEVGPEPPASPLALNPRAKDAALPYRYWFVKDPRVPEYHRLPSRDEQRAALAYAKRYGEILEQSEKKAARYKAGELPNEPRAPAVMRRLLDRGFFVAGAGIEERASRKFVRTVRGAYIKQSQLIERTGSAFRGVALDEETTLPVAWAVRSARPFEIKERDDGTLRFVADEAAEPIERMTQLAYAGMERVGTERFHKLQDGRYLKHWFAAVASRIDRPKGVAADEPWVHVNLGQQTLVLYQGNEPVYATLVSSGLEDHGTPTGLFDVREKRVADTMSDLGPEAGDDRYSIEDVPWTQYFEGSFALHGAFWHERFGLQRSHGCVNLSPPDAHHVFEHTWPPVGSGWHGMTTDKTGLKGSKVYITAE